MAVTSELKCGSSRRKSSQAIKVCIKEERNASFKKVSSILQKAEADRTDEEKEVLLTYSDLVKEVTHRIAKRQRVKDRLQEVEDPPELLAEKCHRLAEALSSAHGLVVYTGAGISTAACIPDYRGTNGIWTLLQKGKDIGLHDLTQAEPTLTHMALSQLYQSGILKYVVSQNCDGLHLRSGLPKGALSEVHGNMYLEVCRECKPPREYWRLFDVTENTARFSHRTMRRCYSCARPLVDTIVHFGERGTLQWPLNWPGACQAADKADMILCIGSSLKVLKKYPWLWGMDKPVKKRPKLYIVNLQWTPKDDQAVLKISGKCDEIMRQVMDHLKLQIPLYDRCRDPIFYHCTSLNPAEDHTTTQPLLRPPPSEESVSESREHDLNVECETSQVKVEVQPDDKKSKNLVTSRGDRRCTRSETLARNVTIKDESFAVPCKYVDNGIKTDISHVVSEEDIDGANYLNPVMEIVYDGVKLKVERNLSVEASVKINNDLAILCDRSKIDQSTFMFGSTYDLEGETSRSFHFVSVGDVMEFNEVDSDGNLLPVKDPFADGSELGDPLSVITSEPLSKKMDTITNVQSVIRENTTILEENPCVFQMNSSEFVQKNKLSECIASDDRDCVNDKASSNKCYSISDFLGRNSCYNSINNIGCEMGKSSTRHRSLSHCIETVTSSSVVNCTTPIIYSFLPEIFQIDHCYSKTNNTGKGKEVGSDCDSGGIEPIKNCRTRDKRDNITNGLKTVSPKHCSTKKLSSSQTFMPESTNSLSFTPRNEKLEIKHDNKQNCDDTTGVKQTTKCSFCKLNYGSRNCMFYSQSVPEFHSVTSINKAICECCDEEDDEDEASDNEEKDTNKDTNCDQLAEGDSERPSSPIDKSTSKSSFINPGWYGKGYRKRVKKKR